MWKKCEETTKMRKWPFLRSIQGIEEGLLSQWENFQKYLFGQEMYARRKKWLRIIMYIHILEKSYNNILIKIELRGLSPGQKNLCDFSDLTTYNYKAFTWPQERSCLPLTRHEATQGTAVSEACSISRLHPTTPCQPCSYAYLQR